MAWNYHIWRQTTGAKAKSCVPKIACVYRQVTNAVGNLPQTDRHVVVANYDTVENLIHNLRTRSEFVFALCFALLF